MTQTVSDQRRGLRLLILCVFVVSGFAGLIYESIWSHYLKLFLGHAAYAQTLVLALYMGGMAGGAWLAGHWSSRLKQPLLIYAGVEFVLGFAALLFHKIFIAATDWAFDSVIPSLDSTWAVDVFKWTLGALLILPQCLLLGATFPLVSAGVIRTFPQESGASLSGLYFTNSLGAAVGVLVSGFILIALVGLPGTIMTAGLLNVAIALTVWFALKRTGEIEGSPALVSRDSAETGDARFTRLMLLVAFITGATSFMYEVGWIRMLSLVLGSATHSFELMLSAFILGLALGALLIRSRMDRLTNPLVVLAFVQVGMGVVAVLTLPIYNQSFDWMATALKSLTKTDEGYVLFNLFSHLICVAMMVPVTIFAGMTLPLITNILIKRGEGESAIGRVYAANTIGAITGVLLAVHWFMPGFGLKWLVVLGGFGDLVLGIGLFVVAGALLERRYLFPAVAAGVAFVAVAAAVELDTAKLASGVFRTGTSTAADKVVFHRDGKTSTVAVMHSEALDRYAIANNGKVDAAIAMKPPASPDDSTMILAAAIPLQYRPQARTVAAIGMGSGRSTHAFLEYPGLTQVDTIEIELAVVEGARLFGSAVVNAYEDPRSHIHIEDAKTFFSRHKQNYDIIMSEPSNPWVSGVASLFSREFYARVKHKLNPGGVFVQWFQLYEIEPILVASVMKALAQEFRDYAVFAADGADLLIVAANEPIGPMPLDTDLGAGLTALLKHVGIENSIDLALRQVGSADVMRPFFESYATPPNSDYFPVLDLNAARARYRQLTAREIVNELHHQLWGLAGQAQDPARLSGKSSMFYAPTEWAYQAKLIGQYFQWRQGTRTTPPQAELLDLGTSRRLSQIAMTPEYCDHALLRGGPLLALVEYLQLHLPYAGPEYALPLAQHITRGGCAQTAAQRSAWAEIISHVARKEHLLALEAIKAVMDEYVPASAMAVREILINLGMREALLANQPQLALDLLEQYAKNKGPVGISKALRVAAESRARSAP